MRRPQAQGPKGPVVPDRGSDANAQKAVAYPLLLRKGVLYVFPLVVFIVILFVGASVGAASQRNEDDRATAAFEAAGRRRLSAVFERFNTYMRGA